MRRLVRRSRETTRALHSTTSVSTAAATRWRRRGLAISGVLAAAVTPILLTSMSAAAPVGQGFTVTPSDLSHILRQIKIAEHHVANTTAATGPCGALVGTGPDQIASPLVADGLRTVDGSCNNLVSGQERFGAEGEVFPRLTNPVFRPAEGRPAGFFGPGDPGSLSSSYTQKSGSVYDSRPRTISNLIVDQTSTNPAAVSAAGFPVRTQGSPGVVACDTANEVQALSGTPSADFSLAFETFTTGTLSPTATAAQVKSALVASGLTDITVSGGPLPGAITVTFKGPRANTDVSAIAIVPGTSAVSGLTVATATQGDTGVTSEVQTIDGAASAAFSLDFNGEKTATLPVGATATEVEAALNALATLAGVTVADGPLPATLTITFPDTLGDVADLAVVPGTSAIAGASVATTTPGSGGVVGCVPAHQTLFIPNVTTDVGLSPPFNGLFTIFGQFFDHGVDKTAKGGNGTVFVPLKGDDPLIAGPDHVLVDDPDTTVNEAADNLPAHLRFMPLTRATNQPGADGIVGTSDDIQDATNTDTPFVDQSQTYASHPSHQAFLRDYGLLPGPDGVVGDDLATPANEHADDVPFASGKLINGTAAGGSGVEGGQANWAEVKEQAAVKLGLLLRDKDVLNVPMIATDPYGNFIPGPAGLPQYMTDSGLVEGNLASPVEPPADVKHFSISFLDDIAHSAAPDQCDPDGPGPNNPPVDKTPDADTTPGGSLDPVAACEYDDELLDLHFIGGDGRLNENIALTAVHQVFHSEHNRLVDDIQQTLNANPALLANYQATSAATFTYGERLFQAARFITEMEYQHLVFEEFGRKVQPLINPFAGFAFTQTDINPAVKAEFAHAVYRFGHSMLTEDISRINEDGSTNDIPLLDGFLNPAAYDDSGPGTGTLTADQAGGAILMGMSDQTGNEIDEFVTETLRNNLLGLPLDLAAINMTRARSEGVPPLNVFRKQLYASTNDSQLKPYTNWVDFGQNLKHPESLVNFVAAYGKHPNITDATTIAAKREAARLIVEPAVGETPPADAFDFMNSTGAWANDGDGNSITGLDDVDLWMGGLAERTNLFGGLLGSTFNYVFENQMTDLQNSDRLYYLGRTPGMNLRAQLEGNSFAELVMRNTTAHSLKADAFATADCKFELGSNPGIAGSVLGGNFVDNDPNSECDETAVLIRMADGTIRYRERNSVDPPGINGQSVYNGTAGVNRIHGGNDSDTFWGNEDNDIIEGGDGADVALGGDGNDRITDLNGDDILKGGPGHDAIEAGPGLDIIEGGDGKDFMNGGANINEIFGGPGDDFMILGQGEDAAQGDSGDDWMEGGDQPDLMQGDSGTLFFTDRNTPGHDITIGQAGDDDYDVEGGDDIMVAGPGIEKSAGAAGYDWYTGSRDPQAQNADLNLRILPPAQTGVEVRDRFSEVEALSGGALDDTLRGDSIVPSQVGGGGFIGCDALDQASLGRISGLDALVPDLTVDPAPILANTASHECPLAGNVWGEGNILLGGNGSDLIEGRGADDIIDGDKYLDVRLSVRTNPADPATEIGSADLMEHTYQAGNPKTLQDDVMAGVIDPGNIVAVREILTPGPVTGLDTAVFSDALANYNITANLDGSVTVAHARGTATDGTDTLWNVELLAFSDQTLPVGAAIGGGGGGPVPPPPPPNVAATGAPAIVGGTPATVGVALTADAGTIADDDGISLITFAWQQESTPDTWIKVATGAGFTPGPGQIGHRLRVAATVVDNLGGFTVLVSNATDPVVDGTVTLLNIPATGTPAITDVDAGAALAGRPRVNSPLGVDTSSIADADGLVGVAFSFQWQQSSDGTSWADIAGANGSTFTPATGQLGLLLRVHVFFTDQKGSLEQRDSAATRDVRPARGRGRGVTASVLALARVTVPRTLAVETVVRKGLRVTFTAPPTARLVRVKVFAAGSKRARTTMFVSLTKRIGGPKYSLARTPATASHNPTTIVLRDKSIRRALGVRGTFRIELTPGVSRKQLGATTTRTIVIR